MSKFQKMLIILYIVLSLINIPFVFFINVLSRYAPVDSANMSISYMTNQKFSEDSLEEFINEIYRITPDILGIYIYDENLEIRLSTNTQLVGETIDAKTVSDYAGITRWLASHSSDPKFSATRPLHMAGRGASLMIGNERLYPLIYAPTQAYSSNIVKLLLLLNRPNHFFFSLVIVWWIIPAVYLASDRYIKRHYTQRRWFWISLALSINIIAVLFYAYRRTKNQRPANSNIGR